MNRERPDQVSMQQPGQLANRRIGALGRAAVEQQVVRQDGDGQRADGSGPPRHVRQPVERDADGGVRGRVEGHGARGGFAGSRELAQPCGGFRGERLGVLRV